MLIRAFLSSKLLVYIAIQLLDKYLLNGQTNKGKTIDDQER